MEDVRSDPDALFTYEELERISRFLLLINNKGMAANLVFVVLNTYRDSGNSRECAIVLEQVRTALQDIRGACNLDEVNALTPENIYKAAPSLEIVHEGFVDPPEELGIEIPEDILLGKDLVTKCVALYYEDLREQAKLVMARVVKTTL